MEKNKKITIEEELRKAYANRSLGPSESSKMARSSGVQRQRGLRVLVIDGGGSRGVAAARVLEYLETKLRDSLIKADVSKEPEEVFLADYFDLIAGTSAGGIIALAHGHKRLKLKDIVTFFESGKAFKNKCRSKITKIKDTSNFENLLRIGLGEEDVTTPLDGGERGLKERMLENDLLNSDDAVGYKRPRVFALANPAGTLSQILFTNYTPREYVRDALVNEKEITPIIYSSCSAWEACRATAAAPYIFRKMNIKIRNPRKSNDSGEDHAFWDGGIVNNSPVGEAIAQAEMLFGYDRGIELVVSVGCGIYKDEENKPHINNNLDERSLAKNGRYPFNWLWTLKRNIANSEKEFNQARRNFKSNPRSRESAFRSLFRLNPVIGLNLSFVSNEKSRLSNASDAAFKWCEKNNAVFESIVTILLQPNQLQRKGNAMKRLGELEGEFAILRIDALEASKGFSPSFTHPESKNTPITGEGNPLPTDFHSATQWRNKYEKNIKPILVYLKSYTTKIFRDDIDAMAEVQANTKGFSTLADDIETLRRALSRGYLFPLIEETALQSGDPAKNKQEDLEDHPLHNLRNIGIDKIYGILEFLLPLDKANALYFMLQNATTPTSERGIIWISREHMDQAVKSFSNLEGFRSSIHDNYVRLYTWLKVHGLKDGDEKRMSELLEKYLVPKFPDWMEKDNNYSEVVKISWDGISLNEPTLLNPEDDI